MMKSNVLVSTNAMIMNDWRSNFRNNWPLDNQTRIKQYKKNKVMIYTEGQTQAVPYMACPHASTLRSLELLNSHTYMFQVPPVSWRLARPRAPSTTPSYALNKWEMDTCTLVEQTSKVVYGHGVVSHQPHVVSYLPKCLLKEAFGSLFEGRLLHYKFSIVLLVMLA